MHDRVAQWRPLSNRRPEIRQHAGNRGFDGWLEEVAPDLRENDAELLYMWGYSQIAAEPAQAMTAIERAADRFHQVGQYARELRALADKRGLDRNVWFNNVERIASERIGRETVQYVANIFKYYVAYRLVMGEDSATADAGASSP